MENIDRQTDRHRYVEGRFNLILYNKQMSEFFLIVTDEIHK